MKACVTIIGVCGTIARNYGIGANYCLFFTGNRLVCIKLRENGWYSFIICIDDLKDIFPDGKFTVLQFIFFSLYYFLERQPLGDSI